METHGHEKINFILNPVRQIAGVTYVKYTTRERDACKIRLLFPDVVTYGFYEGLVPNKIPLSIYNNGLYLIRMVENPKF